jgi:hypothetical protein
MDSITQVYKCVIVLLIIIIIALCKCNSINVKEVEIPVTKIKRVHITDTIKETIRDTIVKYITLKVPAPTISETDTTINIYNQAYNDTNLTFNLTANVDGTLVEWNFDYLLKVPIRETITITNTDSIFITKEKFKNMLFLNGIVLGGVNQFDAGIGLSFYQKKGYLYQLNYMPISKSVVAGFSYQFK